MQLLDLLALPDAAANDAAGVADVSSLKHGACMNLIEVLSLCNAQRTDDVPELEALTLDVTDDVADTLWACADALLDAKAECCQEISSLKDDLDTGVIAGVHPPERAPSRSAAQHRICARMPPPGQASGVGCRHTSTLRNPSATVPCDAQQLFVGPVRLVTVAQVTWQHVEVRQRGRVMLQTWSGKQRRRSSRWRRSRTWCCWTGA